MLRHTRNAMNSLIQGSAARHTKLWMRACWREGIVPLLQMHDALECSVTSQKQAELVARLGRKAVSLRVPMKVDLNFGPNWGDAKQTWQGTAAPPKDDDPPWFGPDESGAMLFAIGKLVASAEIVHGGPPPEDDPEAFEILDRELEKLAAVTEERNNAIFKAGAYIDDHLLRAGRVDDEIIRDRFAAIVSPVWALDENRDGDQEKDLSTLFRGLYKNRNRQKQAPAFVDDDGAFDGATISALKSLSGAGNGQSHPEKTRRIVETYDYQDESGTLLFQVLRYDPKGFSQRRPNGNGGWVSKLDRRALGTLPAAEAHCGRNRRPRDSDPGG
jgi:DNA polymerase family A